MNDPDNFLDRWSRRKQEAGERKEEKKEAAGKPPTEPVVESEPRDVVSAPTTTPVPKFDVESLPPIESISAGTDITAFMRTGVPEALKRAALRRAWSSDPAIREFVGLNENYWDAAGPDGIAGFGDLDPNLDIKRMVSELFGEGPREGASSDEGRVLDSSTAPAPNQAEATTLMQPESAPAENITQRNENAAPQTETTEREATEQAGLTEPVPEKKFSRRHGGAIPR